MNVRALLIAALLAAFTALPAQAAPRIDGQRLAIAADDVQQYLDGSFPRTQDALGGLLELTVSHPQLALPAGSRLDLGFDLAMATAGSSAVPVGNVKLSSGLRYDAQTQGFHLEQPTIDGFRPASAGGELDSRTRGLLNLWLADYARREPIYRLDPAIANLLGTLQVRSASIENGRIMVDFNQNLEQLIPAGLLGR